MDSRKIEELLQRYWNCETSLEEEKILKEHFRNSPVPDGIKDSASWFHYIDLQKKKSLNDVAFDGAVMSKVNSKSSTSRRLLYNSMRIAAGIIVVMVAVWFIHSEIRSDIQTTEVVDTYEDPQAAFEETKKALLMISKTFGSAEEQAKKINLFNEAQEQVQGNEMVTDKKNVENI